MVVERRNDALTCDKAREGHFLLGDFMDTKFETILTRLTPVLKRITRRLNGHFTFFSDDDLLQEALIHLWVMFKNDTLSDKTDSYILQGCYFHLKNYIRTHIDKMKSISINTIIDEEDNALENLICSQNHGLFNDFDEKEHIAKLSSYGLSEREMTIIKLLMKGMTVREIAKKSGVSHVMIMKIKNRIKDKCINFRLDLDKGYQN